MAWVYTYPGAQGEVNKYTSVRDALHQYELTLVNRINSIDYFYQRSGALKSDDLKGEYYEKYRDKTDMWASGLKALIDDFFKSYYQLKERITQVNEIINMWQARVNEGYDDGLG